MKKLIVLILLITLSCKNETSKKEVVQTKNNSSTKAAITEVPSIDLDVYNYDGLKPLLNIKDNKVHVVNFWATWCAPCVKELPYFEALNDTYKPENLEVLLVSLDFPNKYETKLKPFITKHQLKSKVVAFDDTDQNRWIPAIESSWSGAIPATLIYKGNKRKFYEQSFTKDELETEIQKFILKN